MGSSSARTARFAVVSLAGILCLVLTGSSSARASGCHANDRPVLGHSFSWERPEHPDFAPQRAPIRGGWVKSTIPPTCPGESPSPSEAPFRFFAMTPILPGLVDDSEAFNPLGIERESRHLPPLRDRLERPPR
ncbi:MAG: hypothetical protein ABS79_02345 [Planctomycetes bacterium SCN 63-9]|nr:MAG: hypothetical protein ABS79_02345 [Planctomycetes bacterium SCN 63-9]